MFIEWNCIVTFDVQDWRVTDNTEAYFAAGVSGQRKGSEMQAIFTPILNQLDNEWFDFKKYDSQNAGIFDHLVVLTSGYGAELGNPSTGCNINQPADRIWSQGFPSIADGWKSSKSNVEVNTFALASAFDDGFCQWKPTEMSLMLHEYVHGFYTTDLYDTDTIDDAYIPSGGTGAFDVMSHMYGW